MKIKKKQVARFFIILATAALLLSSIVPFLAYIF